MYVVATERTRPLVITGHLVVVVSMVFSIFVFIRGGAAATPDPPRQAGLPLAPFTDRAGFEGGVAGVGGGGGEGGAGARAVGRSGGGSPPHGESTNMFLISFEAATAILCYPPSSSRPIAKNGFLQG